ncbi:hypothetical protein N7486_004765 [Penicillium sp. IBT 16267x]|nr:hypothetical protein N7486_004765 [Penicillium sp. IBT 16267x]
MSVFIAEKQENSARRRDPSRLNGNQDEAVGGLKRYCRVLPTSLTLDDTQGSARPSALKQLRDAERIDDKFYKLPKETFGTPLY